MIGGKNTANQTYTSHTHTGTWQLRQACILVKYMRNDGAGIWTLKNHVSHESCWAKGSTGGSQGLEYFFLGSTEGERESPTCYVAHDEQQL